MKRRTRLIIDIRFYKASRDARRGKTNITLWDYAKLERELLSRPELVLEHFRQCGVEALDQLAMYRQIRLVNPDAARRIETVARAMGIPARLDDLLGDVLCDRPGGV